MHLVRHPRALGAHLLALPRRLGLADDGDLVEPRELERGRQLDVQHGVAVRLVAVDDALDRSLDHLFRFCVHVARRVTSSLALLLALRRPSTDCCR